MVDLDPYFQSIESTYNFNIENLFNDKNWNILSCLSHIQNSEKNGQDSIITKHDDSLTLNSNSQGKLGREPNKDTIRSQFISNLINRDIGIKDKVTDDTNLENLEKAIQSKLVNSVNSEKDFYARQYLLYEKLVSSQAQLRFRNNRLFNCNNYDLERLNITDSSFTLEEMLPGLKPLTTWPYLLDDLLTKISDVEFGYFFLKPFDLDNTFTAESISFIKCQSAVLKKSIIECLNNNSDNYLQETTSALNQIYLFEEFLVKGIQASLSVLLLSGNFENLFNLVNTIIEELNFDLDEVKKLKNAFSDLKNDNNFELAETKLELYNHLFNPENKSIKIEELNFEENLLANSIFYKVYFMNFLASKNSNTTNSNDKMDKNELKEKPVLESKINKNSAVINIITKIEDYQTKIIPNLPLIRNFSIYESINISSNILFTPSRYNFNQCTAIATDSEFIYILLAGVNGGLFKIGTGNKDTIKGKIYIHEKNSLFDELSLQMVYLNKRLYIKPSGLISNTTGLNQGKNQTQNTSSNSNSYTYHLANTIINNSINLQQIQQPSLIIVDCETLKILKQTKILFNNKAKHPLVKKKNDHGALLTDGTSLYLLLIEPILYNEAQDDVEDGKDKKDITEKEAINEKSKEDAQLEELIKNSLNPFNNEAKAPKSNYYSSVYNPLNGVNAKKITKKDITTQYPPYIFNSLNLVLHNLYFEEESLTNDVGSGYHSTYYLSKLKEKHQIPINPLKSDNNKNYDENEVVTQHDVIMEIYDSFSHIFTYEECKKALIINSWNAEKTAIYLIDNESEVKENMIILENSTLIAQTKIESTVVKSNKVEFKAVNLTNSNPIGNAENAIASYNYNGALFDVSKFDKLKWHLTAQGVLVGYRFKEGLAILFSTKQEDVKNVDITYSININEKSEISYLKEPKEADKLEKLDKIDKSAVGLKGTTKIDDKKVFTYTTKPVKQVKEINDYKDFKEVKDNILSSTKPSETNMKWEFTLDLNNASKKLDDNFNNPYEKSKPYRPSKNIKERDRIFGNKKDFAETSYKLSSVVEKKDDGDLEELSKHNKEDLDVEKFPEFLDDDQILENEYTSTYQKHLQDYYVKKLCMNKEAKINSTSNADKLDKDLNKYNDKGKDNRDSDKNKDKDKNTYMDYYAKYTNYIQNSNSFNDQFGAFKDVDTGDKYNYDCNISSHSKEDSDYILDPNYPDEIKLEQFNIRQSTTMNKMKSSINELEEAIIEQEMLKSMNIDKEKYDNVYDNSFPIKNEKTRNKSKSKNNKKEAFKQQVKESLKALDEIESNKDEIVDKKQESNNNNLVAVDQVSKNEKIVDDEDKKIEEKENNKKEKDKDSVLRDLFMELKSSKEKLNLDSFESLINTISSGSDSKVEKVDKIDNPDIVENKSSNEKDKEKENNKNEIEKEIYRIESLKEKVFHKLNKLKEKA